MLSSKRYNFVVSAFCVFLFLISFIIIFKSSKLRPVEKVSADDGPLADRFRNITTKRYGDKVPQPIYNDIRVISFVKTLDKVHISVKSTKKYHLSRVPILLLTWFQTVPPKNLFLITDHKDNIGIIDLLTYYGITVEVSECPKTHENTALACKSGHEFEIYYQTRDSGKQYNWYCHFDDDVYVNIKALHNLLSTLNPLDKHYLGKFTDRLQVRSVVENYFKDMKRKSYYFATGAAYCISVGLMDELEQYLRGKKMEEIVEVAGLPDDVVIGLVIEAVLGYNMTDTSNMLSHILPMAESIQRQDLLNQITISYGEWTFKGNIVKNIISLPYGRFTEAEDSTRFFSYHCLLYGPFTSWCNN